MTSKHDVLSAEFFRDPHPTLHRMRAEDPAYWHPELGMWMFTRYADVQAIVRDGRLTAERSHELVKGAEPRVQEKADAVTRFFSLWSLFADPPRHTRLRSLIAKAFTPQTVERLRPFILRIVDERLGAARRRGSMELIHDLALPVPAEVIAHMLGVPAEDLEQFKIWALEIFQIMFFIGDRSESVETAYRGTIAVVDYFRALIAERRRAPQDDLLSGLIHAEEQDQMLSEDEVVATCVMLLIGGHESTSHQIGNAAVALLRNPCELARLQEHPELFMGAIEELFRYDGAAMQLSRVAREDVEIGGQLVRAGEFALGLVQAANHDPVQFPDPDRLDLTRQNTRHVTLGHGVHFCIGAAVARLELEIALKGILTLPGLALGEGPLERIPSLAIRGFKSLPLTFTPHTGGAGG